mgnify:CR=1 FL=1
MIGLSTGIEFQTECNPTVNLGRIKTIKDNREKNSNNTELWLSNRINFTYGENFVKFLKFEILIKNVNFGNFGKNMAKNLSGFLFFL